MQIIWAAQTTRYTVGMTAFPHTDPNWSYQLEQIGLVWGIFLGMESFCWIWIPEFGLIAKPLYESLRGPDTDPFGWKGIPQYAFTKIKDLPTKTLGISNLKTKTKQTNKKTRKLYFICDWEAANSLRGSHPEVGARNTTSNLVSQQLDSVAAGWPGCSKVIVATVLLVGEATELTLGPPLEVLTLHQVQGLLQVKGTQ